MKSCAGRPDGFLVLLVAFLLTLAGTALAAETFIGRDEKNISIRVAKYPKDIAFSCSDGGTWNLGGQSGAISSKDACRIQGILTAQAVKRFHVAVAAISVKEPGTLAETVAFWKAGGWPVKTEPIGTRFLREGDRRLLGENQATLVTVGVFDNESEAVRVVDSLAQEGHSSWVHQEALHLAQGRLTLRINDSTQAVGSELVLQPNGKTRLFKVEYAAGFPWHGFEDRDFRGRMVFHFGVDNTIDCLLTTSLEEVLAGVVPSEISANAQIGALQAQAVAARGEILAKIGWRHKDEGFDTCAEQHCQVYKGETVYSIAVGQKISPTRGYLLTKPNNDILDAVYAANCGGHTEANHLVWTSPPNPILAGVWDHPNPPALDLSEEKQVGDFIRNPPACYCNDPTVEGGNRFRWKKTLDATVWQKIEKELAVGRIKSVTNVARGFSGRIYQMTFVGEKGAKTIRKELNIRRLLDSLRSACFIGTWKRNSAGFIIGATLEGAGFGHGVGMCQTGAQSQAKRGWDFKAILQHYFPGSVLTKWY